MKIDYSRTYDFPVMNHLQEKIKYQKTKRIQKIKSNKQGFKIHFVGFIINQFAAIN